MKVFLTGATGFVGLPLTRSLLRRGWQVTALVRRPDSPQGRTLARLGVHCLAGDITDRESMRAGMREADIVIHNAAWYELGISRRQQRLMHAINQVGTDHMLGLALELGVPRCVYVSSVVYFGGTGLEMRDESYRRQFRYRTYYEQSKTEAHELALDFQRRGLPLVVTCPANVFGPNDHSVFGNFLRLYLNGLMFPFGFSPETTLSPAHVDDVAEGIALAAEKGRLGETYILAGESMPLRDMFRLWNDYPGGFKVRFYLPRWLVALMVAPLPPLLRLMGLPAFLSAETVAASSVSYDFSAAKAQRELGWSARPARAIWQDVFEQELKWLAERRHDSLVSRLKPLERID